jgi:hypothetical protein
VWLIIVGSTLCVSCATKAFPKKEALKYYMIGTFSFIYLWQIIENKYYITHHAASARENDVLNRL